MNNIIRTLLLIVGIGLIGFGIYQMLTPDVQGEFLGIEFSADDNQVSSQSIILVVVGIVALIGSRAVK